MLSALNSVATQPPAAPCVVARSLAALGLKHRSSRPGQLRASVKVAGREVIIGVMALRGERGHHLQISAMFPQMGGADQLHSSHTYCHKDCHYRMDEEGNFWIERAEALAEDSAQGGPNCEAITERVAQVIELMREAVGFLGCPDCAQPGMLA